MLRNPLKGKRDFIKLIPLIDPKKNGLIKALYITLPMKLPDKEMQLHDYKFQIKRDKNYEEDGLHYYEVASFEQFVKELKVLKEIIRNKKIDALRNSIIERGFVGIGPRAEGLIMNYKKVLKIASFFKKRWFQYKNE